MPTISAYTSDELKRKIDQITREEGRKTAQVGSTALELYAQLPASARRAFLEISAAAEESDSGILGRAIAQVSRALLNLPPGLIFPPPPPPAGAPGSAP
jgi:hypothetical protein